MKRWLVLFAFLGTALLTGCMGNGLGDRVSVKAVYVERERQYEARLLVLESTPSADTGQVSEQARCLSGSGETLYEALLNAEQSESRRLFYGQSELLFVGPGLMEEGVFDACRYLASNTSGRPNMAVYGLDADPDAFEKMQEKGTEFLSSVQHLEKKGLYRTFLYQFGGQSSNGVIPVLSVQDTNATLKQLNLYRDGKPDAVWKGAKTELARLLAGQAETLELTLESLPVSFQVRSPKLRFEPAYAEEGMELSVHFSGAIQRLVSPAGAALPGQDRRLEQAIDEEVKVLMEELAADTLGRGNDVFLLRSRFANLDEALCRSMEEDGRLAHSDTVNFYCLLRMV